MLLVSLLSTLKPFRGGEPTKQSLTRAPVKFSHLRFFRPKVMGVPGCFSLCQPSPHREAGGLEQEHLWTWCDPLRELKTPSSENSLEQ